MKSYLCLLLLFFTFACQLGNKETPTEKLKRKAQEYYEKGFYKEAIPYFSSLIDGDSTNGEYFFKRGYCTAWMNKYPAAIRDFQQSIRLNYKKANCYVNLGVLNSFYNDTLAKYYFEKCLTEDPNNAKAQELLEALRDRNSKSR